MKLRSAVISLVAALAVFALAACSSQAASSDSASGASDSGSVASQSSSGELQPADGNVVTIPLEHSAGTGYEWTYEVNPADTLELVGVEAEASSDDETVGGTVRDLYTFRAVEPGEVVVTFTLTRNWESEEGSAETQMYAFTVNDDLQMSLNPYKSQFDLEPDWSASV